MNTKLISLSIIIILVFSGFVFAQNEIKVFKSEKTKEDNYAPHEIIVKFKKGVQEKDISTINSNLKTSILETDKFAGFKRLKIPEGKTISDMIQKYKKNPDVEYAEPNYVAHAFMIPNDPYYIYQWNFNQINMEKSWDISTGTNVIVAVVDTGVSYENYCQGSGRTQKCYYLAPDLAGTTFVAGYDYANNDAHPNDDNSHGTHVTGTIAQTTNNNLGVAGVAFKAKIMPIKVLDSSGSGYYSWIANGIYWAVDHGAKIISMSLGGSSQSQTMEDALAYAYNHGVTVVAAAGNNGANGAPSYPAAYDKYVIAVAATRYDETRSYYSTTGNYVDIAAPGGDTTVDQNGDGYGDGVLQQTFNPNTRKTNDFNYWFFQGTSMATPHVSGVAALLFAQGITNPDDIRKILQSTAKDKGTPGLDPEYGYGIVDAYAALTYKTSPQCTTDADCDDGLYCNGAESCVVGVCKSGTAVDCAGLSDQCNSGVCDESSHSCKSQPKNEGLSCNDGLFCNIGEICKSGVCTGGAARTCDDENACTGDSCDEAADACMHIPISDGISCDDGLFCTVNDVCASGTCSGSTRDCSDAIQCTVDSCNENTDQCAHTPDNSVCTDGLYCNGLETCDASLGCQAGTPVNCNDGQSCTTDSCNEIIDACDNIWPACGLADGCCPAGCTSETDSDCPEAPAIKCWSAGYQYLYANNDQAKKFCKCAEGTYGYSSYRYNFGRKTVYQYIDSGNNENWEVTSRTSYPVSRVKCTDGNWYNTNQDYYYSQ